MNCKIGDLAMVMFSTLPENIGLTVEVIGTPQIKYPEPAWLVKVLGHAKGRLDKSGEIIEVRPGMLSNVQDRCLQPLRGEQIKKELKEKEPVCT